MSRTLFPAVALAAAGLAAGGAAQAQQATPFHWHVLGGYSETLGTTQDYLQGGFLFAGGFSFTPQPGSPLDVRFDLSFSEHNASNFAIASGQQNTNVYIDGGTGDIWSVTGNLVYHVPLGYGMRGYGIAGVGSYHARIALTQSGAGGYYCDPFSYYCDNGAAVVESQGVTKLGWNAGIGVEFPLPYGRSWFIEARYHRIDTNTPIEFAPIAVGYRF